MEISYSVFLGLLQGATEFLPVSSSAHLILAEYFLDLKEAGLAFDVMLHLATLTAIAGYFRSDFLSLLSAIPTPAAGGIQQARQRMLAFYLCVATLPAALLGVTLGKYAESILRSPLLVIFTLSGAGAILWWAEKIGRRERGLESIGGRDAMIIGCAQAIALIPGVSRSGATMSAGLLLGLDRTAAARFSFLLSSPILLGAGGYKILELFRGPGLADGQISFFLVGFLAAIISGYGFIGFLMKFVQTQSLAVFAYYRFCLSTVVAMAIFFGGY